MGKQSYSILLRSSADSPWLLERAVPAGSTKNWELKAREDLETKPPRPDKGQTNGLWQYHVKAFSLRFFLRLPRACKTTVGAVRPRSAGELFVFSHLLTLGATVFD